MTNVFTIAPQRKAPGVYFPPGPRQFIWPRVALAVVAALGVTLLVVCRV